MTKLRTAAEGVRCGVVGDGVRRDQEISWRGQSSSSLCNCGKYVKNKTIGSGMNEVIIWLLVAQQFG